MMNRRIALRVAAAACLLPAIETGSPFGMRTARAQRPGATQPNVPRTEISVELLTKSRFNSVESQNWGAAFGRLGLTARIRPPVLNDKPEITERLIGRTRHVQAIGALEEDGSITFPGRRFRPGESAKIKEWIDELKTYGAQGSDENRPGFGLTPQQLEQVFKQLEAPVEEELAGLDFPEALGKVRLPAAMPLRLTPQAEETLKQARLVAPAPDGLKGLSRGTVLSILLNSAGLGFRPGRTPAGSLELRAVPVDADTTVWPVGWPLEKPPISSMPKLVDVIPVELDEVPLSDVLVAVSAQTGLPIIVDSRRVRAANVDLTELKVSQPLKKMTWSGLLDRVTFPELMRELLQDESGKPFIYVTSRTVKQLNERAEQREKIFESRRKK